MSNNEIEERLDQSRARARAMEDVKRLLREIRDLDIEGVEEYKNAQYALLKRLEVATFEYALFDDWFGDEGY